MQASFRVRSQIRVLVQSALNYAIMLLGQLGLIVGWFVFISWGGAQTRKAIVSQWPLIAGGRDEHWSLLAGTGEAAVRRRFRGRVVDCRSDGDSITEE
jgi:hypothetical protein